MADALKVWMPINLGGRQFKRGQIVPESDPAFRTLVRSFPHIVGVLRGGRGVRRASAAPDSPPRQVSQLREAPRDFLSDDDPDQWQI